MSTPANPQDRLISISRDAGRLINSTPDADMSTLRPLLSTLRDAATGLGRVLNASKESVPTVRIVRFATVAEDALRTIDQLTQIYGEDPAPADIETAAEADLETLIRGLAAFVKKTRAEVVTGLRGETQRHAETLDAWDLPETDAPLSTTPDVTRGIRGALAETLLVAVKSESAPAPTPAPTSTKTFLSSLLRRTQRETGPLTFVLTDTEAKEAMENAGSRVLEELSKTVLKRLKLRELTDERHILSHPDLKKAGLELRMRVRKEIPKEMWRVAKPEFRFCMTGEIPEIRTRIWDALAVDLAGDANAYHRALHFKSSPDFRDAVVTACADALTQIETQIIAGVPRPQARFTSSVVAAAVRAEMNDAHGISPSFGLRAACHVIAQQNPGLAVRWGGDGLYARSVQSVESPRGLAQLILTGEKLLAESGFLDENWEMDLMSSYRELDLSKPRSIILPASVLPAVPDLHAHCQGIFKIYAEEPNTLIHLYYFDTPDDAVVEILETENGDVRVRVGAPKALKEIDEGTYTPYEPDWDEY